MWSFLVVFKTERMPTLIVKTNIHVAKESSDNILKDLSKVFASAIGKPEKVRTQCSNCFFWLICKYFSDMNIFRVSFINILLVDYGKC